MAETLGPWVIVKVPSKCWCTVTVQPASTSEVSYATDEEEVTYFLEKLERRLNEDQTLPL
jgi:hypothetical protein